MLASANRRLLAERLAVEFNLDEGDPGKKALADIFEVEPVPLDTFIKDKKFLGQPYGLSPIQYDFARHFEQILFPETYVDLVRELGDGWTPVRFVNELIAEWGKGAGKDFVLQVCFARVAYLLLTLRNPQEYFNMAGNTQIHMLNVAYSATQAHASFFKPLRNLLVSSPFFNDKFEAEEPGPQAIAVRFDKQLELVSGHSDADSLEGKNLIAAVADEVSAFPTIDLSRSGKPPARTADAITEMLLSSARTRFPYTHKVAQISFPRSKGDAIQRARVEAEEDIAENGDQSAMYASGPYRTWEVNPIYTRTGKWVRLPGMDYDIPDAPSIVRDYKKRRKFAEAKYECRPSASGNPYYQDDSQIDRSFSESLEVPPLKIDYGFGIDAAEGETVPSWQVQFSLHDLAPIPGAIYAIHADMAISGDRAGLSMCHVKEWRTISTSDPSGVEATEERRPVIKVDFATAFEADSEAVSPDGVHHSRNIQIRWYRKLVMFLAARGFVFGSVSMDGFESADSLQIMAARGYEVRKVSVDRTNHCWKTLGDLMSEGRIIGPAHPLLRSELKGLTPSGNKVDHPPNGSKDIADAVAASVSQAVLLGGQEESVGDADLSSMFSVPTTSFDTSVDSFSIRGGRWGVDRSENFSQSVWSDGSW